ncbi:MAG: CPBP family intramembrane metalloprotease [Ruminococcus sp.]|nr:CPBP family intramembrane metalloprotease [Ruminococcus sp.]
MKNKTLDLLRVVIFTFLANFLFWFLMTINSEAVMRNSLFLMSTPMVTHILTRLITRDKETVKELLLPANLSRNIKYYILSVLIPYLMLILSTIIIIAFYSDGYNIKNCLISGHVTDFVIMIILAFGNAFFMFYTCIGEEYGWRAYLTPKLESLMPEPLALIISGIILGMWHASLIKDYGHNFGTGYKFFPYAGYVVMCIICIFLGAFFTWLTKKTKSIYPSAIAHTAIDSVNITDFFITQKTIEKVTSAGQDGFNYGCLIMSGTVIVGAVFFVMLCIENKKKKSLTEQE